MSVSPDGDTDRLGTQILTIGVVLAIGLLVLSTLISTSGIGLTTDGSVAIDGPGDTIAVGDVDTVTVSDSTGRAAKLDGSGSVAIAGGLNVSDQKQFSFGTYAAVDDVNRSQAIFGIEDEYQLSYNGTTNEYELYYFNDSSRNSYRITVAAANPTTLRPVLVERDGATLTLTNGTGAASSVTITPNSNTVAAGPTNNSLAGRLDETRSWHRPLTASEAATYRSDGIEPVAVGNRSTRLMYDQTGSDVAVEFRSASGELQGDATRGAGLDGTTLTEGTDYNVTFDGEDLIVEISSGGELEQMPRVAISSPDSSFEQVLQLTGTAFGLGALVAVVLVAVKVLRIVRRI